MPISGKNRFSSYYADDDVDEDEDVASSFSLRRSKSSSSLSRPSTAGSRSVDSKPVDLSTRISKSRDEALVSGISNRLRDLEEKLSRPIETLPSGRIAGRRALARRLARGAPRWQDPLVSHDDDNDDYVYFMTSAKPRRQDFGVNTAVTIQPTNDKESELRRGLMSSSAAALKALYADVDQKTGGPYRSQRSNNLNNVDDDNEDGSGLVHGILQRLRGTTNSKKQSHDDREDLDSFAAQVGALSLPRSTDRGNDEDFWTRMAHSRGELGQLEQLVQHTFDWRREFDISGATRRQPREREVKPAELDLYPTAALAVRWAQARLNNAATD